MTIQKIKTKYSIIFFIILLIMNVPCMGHAHIFIDYTVTAVFDQANITGLHVSWTFDKMFSAFIRKEFDMDKNESFSTQESGQIFSKSFCNLAQNDYFAIITLDKKNLPVAKPENFIAELIKKEGVVKYSFFMPLNIPVTQDEQLLLIYFFDPVIYISFTVMKRDIAIINASQNINASMELKRVKYINCPTILFNKQ